MARINQPLRMEKSFPRFEKSDGNHHKGAMHSPPICDKTLRRPIKGGETFSGRGAIPHRR